MISVIIRTHNEMRTLAKLIDKLKDQSFRGFEIIVVDNESTDGTYEYSIKNANKVVTIKREDFSHARSCNLGIEASEREYIYFTNGHSLPLKDNMFEESLNILRNNTPIGGLFGRAYPYKNKHTFIEKISSNLDGLVLPSDFKVFNKYVSYMQHTITCLNRAQLLRDNPYKEMNCKAGEDTLWALEMLQDKHSFAYTPLLDVYHSHGGSNIETLRRYWLYYISTKEAKRSVIRNNNII